jgi:hypothetical protein
MRRTKAAQIYRKTGTLESGSTPPRAHQLESAIRYLGIEMDDALTIPQQVEP